jgi:hypothetical protein
MVFGDMNRVVMAIPSVLHVASAAAAAVRAAVAIAVT